MPDAIGLAREAFYDPFDLASDPFDLASQRTQSKPFREGKRRFVIISPRLPIQLVLRRMSFAPVLNYMPTDLIVDPAGC